MAIRPSMVEPVRQLRQFGQCATDDVFDGITYWTDDQLQQIADKHYDRQLISASINDPEGKRYKVEVPAWLVLEDDFKVYEALDLGVEVSVEFTFDVDKNEITFASEMPKAFYRVFAPCIKINEALADLWMQKANQRFNYIDWKAQNNKMNMKQEYDHCIQQAAYYRNKTIRSFGRGGRKRHGWTV